MKLRHRSGAGAYGRRSALADQPAKSLPGKCLSLFIRAVPELAAGSVTRWCKAAVAVGSMMVTACASAPAGSAGEVRSFPGFLPDAFATEPLALLPARRISLPPKLTTGPEGERLVRDIDAVVRDRLPEEVRVLHSRGPVYGFREWAGEEERGARSGYLGSILAWEGAPGPAGELPEMVGNSVEALGDARGIRFFLFPRELTIVERSAFDYDAMLDAYLLDARGERVVWAGTGRASGTVPPNDPERLLSGIVRNAAVDAVADLAMRLPGTTTAGSEGGFSDVQP